VKEPYIILQTGKGACSLVTSAKEPFIPAKEPYISAKEPYTIPSNK